MSSTPRTDAITIGRVIRQECFAEFQRLVLHAQTLERELTAVSAEITRLRAELAERDAEVARLLDAFVALHGGVDANLKRIAAEQPRTDSEWKAADRKKRINDLAARYAGQIAGGGFSRGNTVSADEIVAAARVLAAAVVEAEE